MTARTPQTQRRAGARFAAVLALLLVPGTAHAAAPAVLCVVQADEGSAPSRDDLLAAIALEQRKAGVSFDVAAVPEAESCPRGPDGRPVQLRVGDGSASIRVPGEQDYPLDLSGVEAGDRAADLARRVVALFAVPALRQRAPVVEDPLPGWAAPRTAIQAPGPRVLGLVQAGGGYAWHVGPGSSAALLEAEGGVALFDERLAIVLRTGWQPPMPVAGTKVGARAQAVPLGLMVRGGLRFAPVLLQAGVGVGLEWRRVSISPVTAFDGWSQSSVSPAIDGELAVTLALGPVWRLSFAAGARFFPAWTDVTFAGDDAYRGPRVTIAAALRVGAVFGGRGGK